MAALGTVEGLYDFEPMDAQGLGFKKGDTIVVFQKSETGWWEGVCNGQRGWFPSNYTSELGRAPSSWVIQRASDGRSYYYNVDTGKTSWDKPADAVIAPAHVEKDDDEPESRHSADSGALANASSSSSLNTSGTMSSSSSGGAAPLMMQRAMSVILPEGWTTVETDDGRTFYYHKASKQIQALPPGQEDITQILKKRETPTSTELPSQWGEKQMADGRKYYYNKVTNETTWKREDCFKARSEPTAAAARTSTGAAPAAAGSTDEKLEALLKRNGETEFSKVKNKADLPAWKELLGPIYRNLRALNEAAKNAEGKGQFVTLTKNTMNAIRELLVATGTYEATSAALKNKNLANAHKGLTDHLNKLVLTAKLASGVWPPPDANEKMQAVAFQILTALATFVQTACEAAVPITYKPKPKPTIAPKPKAGGATPPPVAAKPRSSAAPPPVAVKPSPISTTAAAVASSAPAASSPIVAKPAIAPKPVKPTPAAAPAPEPQPAAAAPADTAPAAVVAPAPVREPTPEPGAPVREPTPEPVSSSQSAVDAADASSGADSSAGAAASAASAEDLQGEGSGLFMEDEGDLDASMLTGDVASVVRLDELSKEVITGVQSFVGHIRNKGMLKASALAKDSAMIVELSGAIVRPVGTILEVLGEIADPFGTREFHDSRQALSDNMAMLIAAVASLTDQLPPPDAMKKLMLAVQNGFASVETAVLAAKNLVEAKELSALGDLEQAASDISAGREVSAPSRRLSVHVEPTQEGERPPTGSTPAAPATEGALSTTTSSSGSNMTADGDEDDDLLGPTPGRNTKKTADKLGKFFGEGAPTTPVRGRAESTDSFSPQMAPPSAAQPETPLGDDDDDDDLLGPARGRNSKKSADKLGKFFGVTEPQAGGDPNSPAAAGALGHRKSSVSDLLAATESSMAVKPKWLEVDYDKGENLLFTMENRVKGGTLPALVERMTQHDQHDAEFLAAFLLTYRSFTTPRAVLDALIARFDLQPRETLTPAEMETFVSQKLMPIRLRITNALKTWLDAYYEDFDPEMIKVLVSFVKQTYSKDNKLKTFGDALIKQLEKKKAGTISRKMVFSGKAPLPLVNKSVLKGKAINFIELDPLEVARQLTLMESKLYNSIESVECLNKSWSLVPSNATEAIAPTSAPNIRAMINRANQLTAFVVESVLKEKDLRNRIALLKHFIDITERCRSLNNFTSMFAIMAGLGSAPIHRLKRTWSGVSDKYQKSLAQMRLLMENTNNFGLYRKTLHSIDPPCVPFLGLYLTDLTFIEDGNPNNIKGTDLINFDKRYKIAVVIREIQQYQTAQYCLQVVPPIEAYLDERFRNVLPIDKLYDLSLEIEPRETNDEIVVRLLKESGYI